MSGPVASNVVAVDVALPAAKVRRGVGASGKPASRVRRGRTAADSRPSKKRPSNPRAVAPPSLETLKHGYSALASLLPGEDPSELARLRLEYEVRYPDASPIERVLHQRALAMTWRLRRLARAEEALAFADYDRRFHEWCVRRGQNATLSPEMAAFLADQDRTPLPRTGAEQVAEDLRRSHLPSAQERISDWEGKIDRRLIAISQQLLHWKKIQPKREEPEPAVEPRPADADDDLRYLAEHPPAVLPGMFTEAEIEATRVFGAGLDARLRAANAERAARRKAAAEASAVSPSPFNPAPQSRSTRPDVAVRPDVAERPDIIDRPDVTERREPATTSQESAETNPSLNSSAVAAEDASPVSAAASPDCRNEPKPSRAGSTVGAEAPARERTEANAAMAAAGAGARPQERSEAKRHGPGSGSGV